MPAPSLPPPALSGESLEALANILVGTIPMPDLGEHPDWSADSDQKWQARVLSKLAEWERDPSGLIEADIEPPTAAAVARIRSLTGVLRRAGGQPPGIAAPDGDGGVSLEWPTIGQRTLVVQVDRDGGAEVQLFLNYRVQVRSPLAQHDGEGIT